MDYDTILGPTGFCLPINLRRYDPLFKGVLSAELRYASVPQCTEARIGEAEPERKILQCCLFSGASTSDMLQFGMIEISDVLDEELCASIRSVEWLKHLLDDQMRPFQLQQMLDSRHIGTTHIYSYSILWWV